VGNSFTADSSQTVTSRGIFDNWTRSEKLCAGGGFKFPPGPEVIFDVHASFDVCMGWEQGNTFSRNQVDTRGDGTETRSSFSFARGIRSPATPFPGEPVGSLLLVQMPLNEVAPARALSVRVLIAPYTSVMVSKTPSAPPDQASDFYLVVNDGNTGCAPRAPDFLHLQVTQLTPAGPASQALADSMAAAIDTIKAESADIVAQGRVLPAQLDQLRRDAYAEVYRRCVYPSCTNLAPYAESLKNLFETFIAKQLTHVQREVEMVNIERQLRSVMMDVQVLKDERQYALAAGRLSSLIPTWALRELDGLQLRSELRHLGQVLTEWIAPIVYLRHPEVLTSFGPEEIALLDRLTRTSTTAALDVVATDVISAARVVESRLRAVRIAAQRPIDYVTITIPRPGYTRQTPFRTVDSATAAKFWADVLSAKDPAFTIKPELFYNVNPYFLPCNYSAPIINSVVFYLFHHPFLNFPRGGLTSTLNPAMRFPLVSGIAQYDFVNATYLGPFVTVLTGSDATRVEEVIRGFWAETGSQTSPGLSPFTDWHFDLEPYRLANPSGVDGQLSPANPWSQAEEFVIAFKVEPRVEAPGQPLPGVLTCQ
jgi:hypothetical protein